MHAIGLLVKGVGSNFYSFSILHNIPEVLISNPNRTLDPVSGHSVQYTTPMFNIRHPVFNIRHCVKKTTLFMGAYEGRRR
jgi:hypothetical protein